MGIFYGYGKLESSQICPIRCERARQAKSSVYLFVVGRLVEPAADARLQRLDLGVVLAPLRDDAHRRRQLRLLRLRVVALQHKQIDVIKTVYP